MSTRTAPACRGLWLTIGTRAGAFLALLLIFPALPTIPPAAAEAGWRSWREASPAFVLPSTAGGEDRLEQRRGRVVLVHFFATWCAPCREELPALQRFVARAEPARLAVLIISVAEPDDRVRRFLAAQALDLAVLLDRDRAVAKAWGIAALPTTVVLGPDLTPRLGAEADIAWDDMSPEDLIARAEASLPPAQPDDPPARADEPPQAPTGG